MNNDTNYIVTRKALVEIFDEWSRRWRENPEEFDGYDDDASYGEDAADYFIKIMQEV